MEFKIAIAAIYVAVMVVFLGVYVFKHCKAINDAYENPSFYGERKDND